MRRDALGAPHACFERTDAERGRNEQPRPRRDVDLYVYVDDLDATFARVAPVAELVEPIHDTEYGMREFILRDPNRFWLTFGQPLSSRDAAARRSLLPTATLW